MTTWYIIPAYNEASVIHDVVAPICAAGNKVVVVDDGSSDATADEASRGGADVVPHILNTGQGGALRTGLRYALRQDAEFLVTFDADGQHDPEDADKMLEKLRAEPDLDIILASRFLGQTIEMPLMRKIVVKGGLLITRRTSGLTLTDTHNGLRAMRARAAKKLTITSDGMGHASEILDLISDKKLQYCEMPCTIRYTAYSLAKGQSILNSISILQEMLFQRLSK